MQPVIELPWNCLYIIILIDPKALTYIRCGTGAAYIGTKYLSHFFVSKIRALADNDLICPPRLINSECILLYHH
jgi:hypothetical protein